MNKLRITYNNAMRRLFNLHFRCSASEMFANCNVHSMDEMRTCIWGVSRKLATFKKNDCNRHDSQRFECVIIALSIFV